jgi:diadenylate cyclase
MWQKFMEFFAEGTIARYILDGYLLFVIVFFILWFALKSKHFLSVVLPLLIFGVFCFLAIALDLKISGQIYKYILITLPILFVIVMAPDIHNWIDTAWQKDQSTKYVKGTSANKQDIADAVMFLSSRKIGALITIEKHKLLDQYAEKAIVLNAEISKELLINIFSPLTPLHDGAVIIKGNKIRCAGAYYVLSTRDNLDKTVGSRHRAALGIAEVTDSITIVVSEETGKISITYSGIIITISDKDKLLEYIDLAME